MPYRSAATAPLRPPAHLVAVVTLVASASAAAAPVPCTAPAPAAVWKAAGPLPAAGGWQQRLKDEAKEMLRLRVKLWEGVLAANDNRAAGVDRVAGVLREGKGRMMTLVDASAEYARLLGQDLVELDPDLFNAAATPEQGSWVGRLVPLVQWGVPPDAP